MSFSTEFQYRYTTKRGVAWITYDAVRNRYHAFFEQEDLGDYETPAEAAAKLSVGRTAKACRKVDISSLHIPITLSDWTPTGKGNDLLDVDLKFH